MRVYSQRHRKQPPAPPGLRQSLARIVGESVIDGLDEKELADRLTAASNDPQEVEAALKRWRDYCRAGVVL
jgi:hypothetical protein